MTVPKEPVKLPGSIDFDPKKRQQRLHEILHIRLDPVVRVAVGILYNNLKDLIAERRKTPWNNEFVIKLDKATQRFVKRVNGELLPDRKVLFGLGSHEARGASCCVPEFAELFKQLSEIICLSCEEEKMTQKWFDWIMVELWAQGLFKCPKCGYGVRVVT